MARSERHALGQERQVDHVDPGFYRLALVKGGWRVPCRICHEDNGFDPYWWGEIDGEANGLRVRDPFDCPVIVQIHEWGEKISDRQFDWLVAIKQWAAQHDPSHPCLHPRRRIDHMNLRPLIPRKPWQKDT
jgi:hypothetical protein